MSKFRFRNSIAQSFKSFFRNGAMSFASVAVLMACLTVLGAFGLLVININRNLESFGNLNKIVIFCDKALSEEQVDEVERQIRKLDNVDEDSFVRISKVDALNEEKAKYPEFKALFDEMEARGDNPYPDSFEITYKDNSNVSTLNYQLEHIEGISKVKCREDLAGKIDDLKKGITFIFAAFLVILFVVSLFVIINTIKLAVFARSKEISVMRYVGATKPFIAIPFIFEGIIIGIISSAVAYFVEWYVYSYATKSVVGNYNMINVVPFSEVNVTLYLAFLAVGVFAGIVGSCISLGKYLKA